MSNRSLARKNRKRYKDIRSPGNSSHYKVILGSIGCNELTGNGRIYPDFDKVQKEPLLCYTKTPSRLESVTMDLEK